MGRKNNKHKRIGEKRLNNQGSLMKVVEYNSYKDIIVEFQDEYRARVHTRYNYFIGGNVKNPYFADVFDIGMIGNKYPSWANGESVKEYYVWKRILERCYYKNYQKSHPTYKSVLCCKEWVLYENFYEWLHSQENFNKWLNGERWAIDKDILVKGSKVYSPETCCLVPQNVNNLFVKNNISRGESYIGVYKQDDRYVAMCQNPFAKGKNYVGTYDTPEEAFYAYKEVKENYIKQVAQDEYSNGNITKECYEAMLRYEVEITD